VAAVFLFRAGQFHTHAATPFRRRLEALACGLGCAGLGALLALGFGSVGLLVLRAAASPVLTAVSIVAAVSLLVSAMGALKTAYVLWQILREVSGGALPKS